MTPSKSLRIATTALVLCLARAESADAAEGFPDWKKLRDVEVIEIVTTDEDGDLRETKVWFVLVDGQPYLRTSASAWLDNIARGSPTLVRIEGLEYAVGTEVVEGDEIIAKVDAYSAVKYGWQERLIHFFRMRKPDILRIVPER